MDNDTDLPKYVPRKAPDVPVRRRYGEADGKWRKFGRVVLCSIAILLVVIGGCVALWHKAEESAVRDYFLRADPGARVEIDRVVTKSSDLFVFHEAVLFHTSNATMQKVFHHYRYARASQKYTAPMSLLSNRDIETAGQGRYRQITVKKASWYSATGPETFTMRTVYWDAATETGCYYLDSSD